MPANPSGWATVEANQIVSREALIRGRPCLTLAADIARALDAAELRGVDKAVAAERAAVVAWLSRQKSSTYDGGEDYGYEQARNGIAAGDHLKEPTDV